MLQTFLHFILRLFTSIITPDTFTNFQHSPPEYIHFIWLGPLKDEIVNNALNAKEYLPESKVIFWCDQHEKWLDMTELSISDRNISFRSFKDLLGHSEKTDSVIQREYEGYANYAAVSDVLRLLALYKYGGLYLDVDTTLGNEKIQDKQERISNFKSELDDSLTEHSQCELLTPDKDIKINFNNVIFAQKGSPLISELLDDINSSYCSLEETMRKLTWINKRCSKECFPVGKNRHHLTIEFTGPSLLAYKKHRLDFLEYKKVASEQAKTGRKVYPNPHCRIDSFDRPMLFNGEASARWGNQYHTSKGPKSFEAPQASWSIDSTNLLPF